LVLSLHSSHELSWRQHYNIVYVLTVDTAHY